MNSDNSKMTFVCPYQDNACKYIHDWIQYYVKPYAENLGLWDIINITKENAVGPNVRQSVSDTNPRGILEEGHGSKWTISGHDTKMVWWCGDQGHMDILSPDRIVHFISCHTGADNGIGCYIINNGGVAFCGHNDIFWASTKWEYRDAECELWIALMDGDTFDEAKDRMLDKYDYCIDQLIQQGYSPAHLIWNRDTLVFLGNMNAKLIEVDDNEEVVTDVENIFINVLN